MTDKPIAYTAEGRPLFDNTPTVVCLLVPRSSAPRQLLVIRRGGVLGHGLLGLPGGYHMRGETWQRAGCREVYEETGYIVFPTTARLIRMDTDEYGNNLVFAKVSSPWIKDTTWKQTAETLEVLWLTEAGNPDDWAFPRHFDAAKVFFEGSPSQRMDDKIVGNHVEVIIADEVTSG